MTAAHDVDAAGTQRRKERSASQAYPTAREQREGRHEEEQRRGLSIAAAHGAAFALLPCPLPEVVLPVAEAVVPPAVVEPVVLIS